MGSNILMMMKYYMMMMTCLGACAVLEVARHGAIKRLQPVQLVAQHHDLAVRVHHLLLLDLQAGPHRLVAALQVTQLQGQLGHLARSLHTGTQATRVRRYSVEK